MQLVFPRSIICCPLIHERGYLPLCRNSLDSHSRTTYNCHLVSQLLASSAYCIMPMFFCTWLVPRYYWYIHPWFSLWRRKRLPELLVKLYIEKQAAIFQVLLLPSRGSFLPVYICQKQFFYSSLILLLQRYEKSTEGKNEERKQCLVVVLNSNV